MERHEQAPESTWAPSWKLAQEAEAILRKPSAPSRAAKPTAMDVDQLAADLEASIQGEVRFSDADRGMYATDASNYRQVPIGVVLPRNAEDVQATIAVCRHHGAPILTRGGGTSLAGQCCNVAVVMDMSRYMDHILEIDPRRRLARVQPGVILDRLREQAEEHGLTFGPDPSTHKQCTLGGMIGNNSCGTHSVVAGRTADNIESLDIVLYDGTRMQVGATSEGELAAIILAGGRKGEIYGALRDLRDRYAEQIRKGFPRIPRRVSGFNLDELLPENGFHVARALVGTEATCVTVLEATVNLIPSPPVRQMVVLGFSSVFQAADAVPRVLRHHPLAVEGLDDELISYMYKKKVNTDGVRLLPKGNGWLVVEFGGDTREEARRKGARLVRSMGRGPDAPGIAVYEAVAEQELVWQVRKSGLGATAFVPGHDDTWEGWEDAAVHPRHLGSYLRDFKALLHTYEYSGAVYGHFGDGCIHTRISFNLVTAEGVATFRRFIDEAADTVLRYGGSFSGEHGDGQSRAEILPRLFGAELMQAFREFKGIWDPGNCMNPGKVVDPYKITDNLRLGTGYHPGEPETWFQYPDDEHSFRRAAMRCVGVGECRRESGGTMCPSYMVTKEEKHTTRGRAHLLFEMLEGNPVKQGWRDEGVKESLDLCLACKGCKNDCPVNVDVATYKAEFMAHYYQRRLRPPPAYALGLVYWWSRLGSLIPGLANVVSQTPGINAVAKAVAGIAPERSLPRFSPRTFTNWFFSREPAPVQGRQPVILWPDTFNNHFHTDTAIAAVEVLEAAGCHVIVPCQSLCCGRPLYDYGFLDTARKLLREVMDSLRPLVSAGVPLVGLEPSCLAVFRDELKGLFPEDVDAIRLRKQAFTLAEFLERYVPDFRGAHVGREALVQKHCHQGAILGFDSEQRMYRRFGIEARVPDSGCCGMAGSFGFEKEKYDVSEACGERVIRPEVRSAKKSTVIMADGFSCREQIRQGTDRVAVHFAQVLRSGLHGAGDGLVHDYPERDMIRGVPGGGPVALPVAMGVGLAVLVGAGLWWMTRR